MAVQRQQMARTLTAQHPLVARQLFQHIAVTHLGPHKFHATFLQCHLDGHVGHQRAHHSRHMLVAAHAFGRHQIQKLVTVVQAPRGIHHLQAVGIAV